jgi:hypothetical protein
MTLAVDRESVASRAESNTADFKLRLRAVRQRRMDSRISGARSSAFWIAGFAGLAIVIGAGLLSGR